MKLTFKDLQQKKFSIDVEPSDTILQVKQKIQESEKHDVEAQKLIYSGKILQDDQTVESYKIQEKDFVVCMVKKPKPAPSTPVKPSTPTPTTATPSVPLTAAPAPPQPGAVPVPATPATSIATSPPPAPQPVAIPVGPAAFNDPNAFSVGAARAGAINELMNMGFSRPDVERAMRAAFNNPDRAVEYLMDGIPAHLQQEAGPRSPGGAQPPVSPSPQVPSQQPLPQAPLSPSTQATAPTVPATAPAPASNAPINLFEAAARAAAERANPAAAAPRAGNPLANLDSVGTLEALRNNPQFQQLRTLVQSNPQLLEPIIQNIAQGNPQFAALINQNPEGFFQLLAEGAGGAEGGILPAGAIQVTPEEAEAIGRLEALGFPRNMAVTAYIACDKDEEIAANYLFEHGFDDDDDEDDMPPA